MRHLSLLTLLALGLSTGPARAAEISTHILDLDRGVGGAAVPVILAKRDAGGTWSEVGRARTDGDGRVRSFGDQAGFGAGVYRLQFDMTAYPAGSKPAFFPEIAVTFTVADPHGRYHVPVVVSPYGYSTYRGN